MKKVTKDMPITKVLQEHPETISVFEKHGLHCIGCHLVYYDNIEHGCMAHNIDTKKLIDELNKTIAK
ncbi:MAG TPA: DUF1858 domain-containing protein [Candidatus Nanoarchaeia archaeon]|nr:DUF1858 domain-containing protein [Candidatus Nanoarchaeia archaeon]